MMIDDDNNDDVGAGVDGNSIDGGENPRVAIFAVINRGDSICAKSY